MNRDAVQPMVDRLQQQYPEGAWHFETYATTYLTNSRGEPRVAVSTDTIVGSYGEKGAFFLRSADESDDLPPTSDGPWLLTVIGGPDWEDEDEETIAESLTPDEVIETLSDWIAQ